VCSQVIRLRSATILAALLASAACGGTTVAELAGPDAVRCQISLGSATASVPAEGGQISLAVSAARDCTWSSQTDVAWVQVSPASGQGEASISVTVAENPATTGRTGRVTVNAQQFQISQAAASASPPPPPCSYSLSPVSRSISESGGTRSVRVSTGATCGWSASTTVSWIVITSATSGVGTADISYRVERNRSSSDRVGVVAVEGRLHIVRQDGD
jgi:hypothetical protein